MTGRPALISLVLATFVTTTALAQPAQPTVPKLTPPVPVPWVGFPWLPKDNPETGQPGVADSYQRLSNRLDALLKKPCLNAKEQAAMLAEAKEWIVFLLKYSKNSARTKEEEIEAKLDADILSAKYAALEKKKPCPPATDSGSTTPGTNAGGTGGSTGGGTTGGGEAPKDGPQPCPDPEKVKAAKAKYAEAQKNWMDAETFLGEVEAELQGMQKEQKLVDAYDQALKDNDTKALDAFQKNPEKMREINDARREIDELKTRRKRLRDASSYWAKEMEDAANELKKYGQGPPPPCEPPVDDGLMPTEFPDKAPPAAMSPPVADGQVVFDSLPLDTIAIGNPFSGDGLCCESGVQKFGLTTDGSTTLESSTAAALPRLPLAREWLAVLGRLVRGSIAAASRTPWPAPGVASRPPGEVWLAPLSQGARDAGAPITAVVTSLGTSQGEAFHLQIVNDGSAPIRLSSDAIVVEPLKRAARNEAQKALQPLARRLQRATTFTAEGYCLNYALQPPDAGMLFRVAPPAVQAQFASARGVLRAAASLARAGRLTPDSNAKSYLESIKQYAVWTKLERWNQSQFADAWVSMTKKQMAALKRPWAGEMETMLRGVVPGRWLDIQAILTEADRPAPLPASPGQP